MIYLNRYNETNSRFFDHQLDRYIGLFYTEVKDSLTLENFEIKSPNNALFVLLNMF